LGEVVWIFASIIDAIVTIANAQNRGRIKPTNRISAFDLLCAPGRFNRMGDRHADD
jgi:hypothetical protein